MEDATVSKSSINEKINESENQNKEKKRILQKKEQRERTKAEYGRSGYRCFPEEQKKGKQCMEKIAIEFFLREKKN